MTNFLIFAGGLFIIAIMVGVVIATSKKEMEEGEKMIHFGAVILTGLGLLFSLSMGMYFFDATSNRGKEIFDTSTTILPPLVTLVLGYYFGKKKDA